MVVKDKALFCYVRYQLRLAAAHITEYHRPFKLDKHRLVQPIHKACLERYACTQEGAADQPCGCDPVCVVMRDHTHAVAL
jgi:hypothetical protein